MYPIVENVLIGQILCASWGYEQTNVDFYIVTKQTDKMVEVVPIACEKQYTGDMYGMCTPVPDKIIGGPIRRRFKNGYIKVCSYAWAKMWNGMPQTFTEYA